ncbi:MAG: hypothetical protein U0R66_10285 [Mycobacterium sp.]
MRIVAAKAAALWMATAVAVVLSGCAGRSAPPPPALPGAGTADVHADPSGEMAHLAAVRLEGQDGYDRLVLEFTDRVPGYTIGYQPLPAREDASGLDIPLPGATTVLHLSLNPATAAGWGGGPPTYSGPRTLTADTGSVTEVKSAGDFEAVLTWVAGLRTQEPFRVQALEGPPRLIVDIAH